MEEEAEDRAGVGLLALRTVVELEHAERGSGTQHGADARKQLFCLVRRQVVDDVEAEGAIVGAAEVGLEHVALNVVDAVVHAGARDDLAADAGASRQVDDCRLQPRMVAAERHRELTVGAGDVEQRMGALLQRHRLSHLVGAKPGDLVLAADVGAPVGILGRPVVQLSVAAVANQLLEVLPPLPVLGRVGEEVAKVVIGARIEPATGASSHLIAPIWAQFDVAQRGDHVEDELGARGLEPQVLSQLIRLTRSLCQCPEYPSALRDL